MLNDRKILRFEPLFIDLLNQHVCYHIDYSPGRCFGVMLALFNDLPKQQQSFWINKAKDVSKQYTEHTTYELKPVQIKLSSQLAHLFHKNNDRIIIIAVLLYHNVLCEKKVGV